MPRDALSGEIYFDPKVGCNQGGEGCVRFAQWYDFAETGTLVRHCCVSVIFTLTSLLPHYSLAITSLLPHSNFIITSLLPHSL